MEQAEHVDFEYAEKLGRDIYNTVSLVAILTSDVVLAAPFQPVGACATQCLMAAKAAFHSTAQAQ